MANAANSSSADASGDGVTSEPCVSPIHPPLWLGGVPATNYPQFVSRNGSHVYDVAIIGAGITGLLTAYLLRREGRDVAVVEAMRVCRSTSAFTTAKISTLHRLFFAHLENSRGRDAAAKYGKMNQEGLNLIVSIARELEIDCDLQERAHVCYTCDEHDVRDIRDEVAAAQRAGMDCAYIDHVDELPFPVLAAIRMENQFQFNPYAFCVGLADRLSRGGCALFEETRVVDVSKSGAPHTIYVENGAQMRAQHVVLATHLPILDIGGHFSAASPTSSFSMAFTLSDARRLPRDMYISANDAPTRSLRAACNDTVLVVAGESHVLGEDPDGDPSKRYEALERWTRDHFSVQAKVAQWSAFDYVTGDKLPYIGPLTRRIPTIYLATGYKKWGFTTAGAAAYILCDLIAKRENEWLELVDSRRWDFHHGDTLLGILTLQAHVGKHFVMDRIKEYRAPDIESLEPGQGGLVKANGKCVGAFRDERGLCHMVSPKCEHLGCHVLWNKVEQTWDCPCHGSRYDYRGAVLHGPSVRALAKAGPADRGRAGSA